MWFKNLQVYRVKDVPALDEMEAALSAHPLQPCGAGDFSSLGWVPPRPEGAYVHAVNRQRLIALGIEQKILPNAVVKQHAQERARQIEVLEDRRVGRREFRDLCDAATQELLPRAFVQRRVTYAWIDPVNGWLAVDASTSAKADEVIERLFKSGGTLSISPLKFAQSPGSAMTGWAAEGQAPEGFTVDQDAELRTAENAAVRYTHHPLDGDDIPRHVAAGKRVTRLGMTWNDRISFVLNERLQLKRLAFLDILKESTDGQAENEEERFDLDFTLMTGELARMQSDLIDALGGEREEG
jgi:recombination associated protein RdgC